MLSENSWVFIILFTQSNYNLAMCSYFLEFSFARKTSLLNFSLFQPYYFRFSIFLSYIFIVEALYYDKSSKEFQIECWDHKYCDSLASKSFNWNTPMQQKLIFIGRLVILSQRALLLLKYTSNTHSCSLHYPSTTRDKTNINSGERLE